MIEQLIHILHTGNYTCVIAHGVEIRTFKQRGVTPLYSLVQHDSAFLKDSVVADKVVGKAAAALMIKGGVKRLHADVISGSAVGLLQQSDIMLKADKVVSYIMNRSQTDWCPLEKISYPLCNVDDIFQAIKQFIENR